MEDRMGLDYDYLIGGVAKRLGLEDKADCFEGLEPEDCKDDGGRLVKITIYWWTKRLHSVSFKRFQRKIKNGGGER